MAHIAGIDRQEWRKLRGLAKSIHGSIKEYFKNTPNPTIATMVLPYTICVVLDDPAQPPTYNSPSHLAVLDELAKILTHQSIKSNHKGNLREFPPSFEKIITLSRTKDIENQPQIIQSSVDNLVQELLRLSS